MYSNVNYDADISHEMEQIMGQNGISVLPMISTQCIVRWQYHSIASRRMHFNANLSFGFNCSYQNLFILAFCRSRSG